MPTPQWPVYAGRRHPQHACPEFQNHFDETVVLHTLNRKARQAIAAILVPNRALHLNRPVCRLHVCGYRCGKPSAA